MFLTSIVVVAQLNNGYLVAVVVGSSPERVYFREEFKVSNMVQYTSMNV